MAHFLVTGGAGFIGSHLVDALVSAGHRVRVLDDLSTGRREQVPPVAELLVGDVAEPDDVRRAMEGVDGCFHLAAIASVERCNRDWSGAHRVNLTGTITVFETAVRQGVPVAYASSAAVYGDSPDLPLDEAAPALPLSAYGADKLGCELHARAGGRVHGLRSAGLRFFNVFGPRQDPASPYSGVISIFCSRMKAGQPVTIYGDGGQTRDFVYVADVVQGLLAALDAADTAAPVFNICTGVPTRIDALARQIAETLGVVPGLTSAGARPGDIRDSRGSPARARSVLNWTPRTSLRDGLSATLAAL